MNAVTKNQWAQVKYSQTQLGGGTTAQGVAYPYTTTPNLGTGDP